MGVFLKQESCILRIILTRKQVSIWCTRNCCSYETENSTDREGDRPTNNNIYIQLH